MKDISSYSGSNAKISRNSITFKNDDGKTIGIIRNAYELQEREKSDLWKKYRGSVGLSATTCLAHTRRIDGDYVFLANARNTDERERAEKLQAAGIKSLLYIPA